MNRETDSYLTPKAHARRKPNGQMGIFAREHIERDEIVTVWGGEILSRDAMLALPEAARQHVMQVEEEFFLGGGGADETNYFNHSCDPNVGLSGQMVLRAMREILPGEEICFDYATCDGSPYDEFDCQCGAVNCRGQVRGTDWQIPELWEKYAGYFIPYLQRRIDRLRAQIKTT
ncbi:MAG: SET domain-containing protein-lysine N-methyltransferase [Anaerolineae bacterium]|nr:SET domain-containing protein-lysine N-methyltransferase [Anaerolineae bacterium]